MKRSILTFFAGFFVSAIILTPFLFRKKASETVTPATKPSEIVYSTTETEGYYFPTHNNLLVMDRAFAESVEVIVVEIGAGRWTHKHVHDDTEQLYYVLSGDGKVEIDKDGKIEEHFFHPGDLVHIPRNYTHQTFSVGDQDLRYLAVDYFTFGKKPEEPTWDAHARVICEQNSWSYEESRIKK